MRLVVVRCRFDLGGRFDAPNEQRQVSDSKTQRRGELCAGGWPSYSRLSELPIFVRVSAPLCMERSCSFPFQANANSGTRYFFAKS